jgi:hypothetical protein
MSTNILLAVDTAAHDPARHVVAAAEMTRDLARDSGDHVSRTDLPRMPLGSVAARLLHMATRPVLIVPRPDTGS